MKNRTLPIAGVISVIVLISVQTFIIGQIWHQKNELFRISYSKLAEKAIEFHEQKERINGFERSSEKIDIYLSDFVIKDSKIYSKKQGETVGKTVVVKEVLVLLTRNQDLTKLLGEFFKKSGNNVILKSEIEINSLSILDFGNDYNVYAREGSYKPGSQKRKIFVKRFIEEGNHYRLVFDFYINIADQRAIVFREMTLSLILSLLSTGIVLTIFLLAYKFLMEEKRLSDLKTDFINNMTHELKTPLSTITVASKTLEIDQVLSDKEKIITTARMIGKQSVNLNHLINLILEISIWERTEFEAEMKEMEVGPVLSEIIESFKVGQRENVEIKSDIMLEGVFIKADITYFTTMINNLLSNAVKFSVDKCEINVIGAATSEILSISIIDNGIGISKNDQKHIFEKFYRVSHGNIHKTKGLGLGLYYVCRIIAAHGGTIELSSQPGKGANFTIKIPIK